MLDLAIIRAAVANTISSSVDQAVNVYEVVPASPSYPAVAVVLDSGTYHETFGDNALANVDGRILVAATSEAVDSLTLLDDMLSRGAAKQSSICDALEDDKTLGGVVEQCWVESFRYLTAGEPNAVVFEAELVFHILGRRAP